jgi:K+-transporting ATPase KdpF subunit
MPSLRPLGYCKAGAVHDSPPRRVRHFEVTRAGFVLHLDRRALFRRVLGVYEGLRPSLGDLMEYLIAGITALFLFAYLIYALLRPERF